MVVNCVGEDKCSIVLRLVLSLLLNLCPWDVTFSATTLMPQVRQEGYRELKLGIFSFPYRWV